MDSYQPGVTRSAPVPDSTWSPAYIVSILITFQYVIDYVLYGSAINHIFVYDSNIPHMFSVCFICFSYVFHMYFICFIYVFLHILVVCSIM